MPTLIRLVIFLIFLGGLAFGGMVALTAVVDPGEKEIRVRIPARDLMMTAESRRSAQPARPASRAAGDRARSPTPRCRQPPSTSAPADQSADTGHVDLRMSGSELHLVDAFLEMMSAERGAAKNTIAAYRRDLTDYGAFLSGRGSRSPPRRASWWSAGSSGSRARGSPPRQRAKAQRRAAVPQVPLRRRDPARRSDPDRRLAARAPRRCRRCCRPPRSTAC